MKTFITFVCVSAFLASFGVALAHQPPGVIHFAYEWPDGKLPVLDGKMNEWEDIPDIYVITLDDMGDQINHATPNPADLNARAWITWNERANKMWIGAEVFDDIHYVKFSDPGGIYKNDTVEILIDADHGGEQINWFANVSADEFKERAGRYGQQFVTTYPPPPGLPAFWHYGTTTWLNDLNPDRRPEFASWAHSYEGDLTGQGITRYEIELAVWDELNYRGPELSKRHILKPDEIIGFDLTYFEMDLGPEPDQFWALSDQPAASSYGDRFSDVQLLPGDWRVTAVEANTWARIKAGFAK